jgi:hypothetical protein
VKSGSSTQLQAELLRVIKKEFPDIVRELMAEHGLCAEEDPEEAERAEQAQQAD